MDTYLSCKETVPLLHRSYFSDFRFHKREEVVKIVQDLSNQPYGEVPDTTDKGAAAGPSQQGKKLTPKEMGKLNKPAQILLMTDERLQPYLTMSKKFSIRSYNLCPIVQNRHVVMMPFHNSYPILNTFTIKMQNSIL